MKIKLILISLLILTIIVGFIALFLSPLCKPVESIRRDILKLIPLDTSLEDAVKVFENKSNWKIGNKPNRRSWSPNDSIDFINDPSAKKEIFILSEFAFIVADVVFVFDGDELDRRLICVEVRRYIAP